MSVCTRLGLVAIALAAAFPASVPRAEQAPVPAIQAAPPTAQTAPPAGQSTPPPGQTPPPAGQTPAPARDPQQPVFRTGANLVRVDVTVTNNHGDPVSDLKPDDFQLSEDGVPQTIQSFEFVRATGEPSDDRSLQIRTPQHAAYEATREDVRLFLIFWDEYHIGQLIPATRGREMLQGFVRSAFGPSDLVGLMDQLTTLDSIRFTRDWLALADQIHRLQGRFNLFIPARSAVEEAQLRFARDLPRVRNEVTLSALKAAVAFLGTFREGRKTLLFVSQGVMMFGRNGESEMFQDVIRTANASNTAVYTLDPASEVGRSPGSLLSLAYDTGGKAFVGTNQPAPLLRQIVKDASAFYLLGYQPAMTPVDGKFHKIKVHLKRPGSFDVRARSGYYAPTVAEMTRARETAATATLPADEEHALASLTSSERTDRTVDWWVGMSRGTEPRTRVTLAWGVRPVPPAPAGPPPVAITITAASRSGEEYYSGTIDSASLASFEAPAGELVLKTVVKSAAGETIDGDSRKITVPSLAGDVVAIGTPIVLRARNAIETRRILGGEDNRPAIGREFERSDRLFIRFPVYGTNASAPEVHLLNRLGSSRLSLQVTAVDSGPYQIDLPLSSIAKGDYMIAIDVKRGDETAKSLVPIRVR
jgi:VWFA-related protein